DGGLRRRGPQVRAAPALRQVRRTRLHGGGRKPHPRARRVRGRHPRRVSGCPARRLGRRARGSELGRIAAQGPFVVALVRDCLEQFAQRLSVAAGRMQSEGEERAEWPELWELASCVLEERHGVIDATNVAERAAELEQAARAQLTGEPGRKRLLVERN